MYSWLYSTSRNISIHSTVRYSEYLIQSHAHKFGRAVERVKPPGARCGAARPPAPAGRGLRYGADRTRSSLGTSAGMEFGTRTRRWPTSRTATVSYVRRSHQDDSTASSIHSNWANFLRHCKPKALESELKPPPAREPSLRNRRMKKKKSLNSYTYSQELLGDIAFF